MVDATVMLDGLGFPESLRWHDGRIWACNWGRGEVVAVASNGETHVVTRLEPGTLPFSIDWLPDGPLLIVDGPNRRLLRFTSDEGMQLAASLSEFGTNSFNELVVDRAGDAYVNGGDGALVLVHRDGRARVVAEGLGFPNGMTLVDDGRTLVVADSHRSQLLGFDVGDDATLSEGRTWADLDYAPDGICADAEGAVWVATVPGKRCIRVRKGGTVLSEVRVDRGCFSCMLGGDDGRTLYIGAAVWRGMDVAMREGPGRTGRLLAAPGQAAPHDGAP